jgi:hypothetical protein
VYCTNHVPPTRRVISFLTSRHGRRTTLQYPPPTRACAELLVPSALTAMSLTSLVDLLTVAHDNADPPASCARRSLSTVASTSFHEQLDCLMQSLCTHVLIIWRLNSTAKSTRTPPAATFHCSEDIFSSTTCSNTHKSLSFPLTEQNKNTIRLATCVSLISKQHASTCMQFQFFLLHGYVW